MLDSDSDDDHPCLLDPLLDEIDQAAEPPKRVFDHDPRPQPRSSLRSNPYSPISSSSYVSSYTQEKIDQIMNMGFAEEDARAALKKNYNNVNMAIAELVDPPSTSLSHATTSSYVPRTSFSHLDRPSIPRTSILDRTRLDIRDRFPRDRTSLTSDRSTLPLSNTSTRVSTEASDSSRSLHSRSQRYNHEPRSHPITSSPATSPLVTAPRTSPSIHRPVTSSSPSR
ncbi:hypothetical protein GEMRC1_013666 [Eukaryota sp. GEM-RC1]